MHIIFLIFYSNKMLHSIIKLVLSCVLSIIILFPIPVTGQSPERTNIGTELGISNAHFHLFTHRANKKSAREAFIPYIYYLDTDGTPKDTLIDAFVLTDLYYNTGSFSESYDRSDMEYYLDNIFTKTKIISTTTYNGDTCGLLDNRSHYAISNKNIETDSTYLYQLTFDYKPLNDVIIGTIPKGLRVAIEFFDDNDKKIYIGEKIEPTNSLADTLHFSLSYNYHFIDVPLTNGWKKNFLVKIKPPSKAVYMHVHIINYDKRNKVLIDNYYFNKGDSALIPDSNSKFEGGPENNLLEQGSFERAQGADTFLYDDRTALLDELHNAKTYVSSTFGLPIPQTKVILTLPKVDQSLYKNSPEQKETIQSTIQWYLDSIEVKFNRWKSNNPNSKIELAGIYFIDEDVDAEAYDYFLSYAASAIKSKDWKFFSSPHIRADSNECKKIFNSYNSNDIVDLFDVLWFQPNAFFDTKPNDETKLINQGRDHIKRAFSIAEPSNFGFNIESRELDTKNNEIYSRINDYFDYGYKLGYVNFSKLYYDDGGAHYNNCYSSNPSKRQDYNNLYGFIKSSRRGVIINGGFENLSESDGSLFAWEGNHEVVNNLFSQSRNREIEIQTSNQHSIFSEFIPVQESDSYTMRFQVKELENDNYNNSALFGIIFYDNDGNVINTPPYSTQLNYSSYFNSWYSYLTPNTEYQNFSINFIPPLGTVKVKYFLRNWNTQNTILWRNIYLDNNNLTSSKSTLFYNYNSNYLISDAPMINGNFSVKLGNNKSINTSKRIPVTTNINYTFEVSAKEQLPIIDPSRHNKALIGIQCFNEDGIAFTKDVVNNIAYSSALNMNYFYISEIDHNWYKHIGEFSFQNSVASIKIYIRNWGYDNELLFDNLSLKTDHTDNVPVIIDDVPNNILDKYNWGEPYPMTVTINEPVYYNDLINVSDIDNLSFSALLKTTETDTYYGILGIEFLDDNFNMLTDEEVDQNINLSWSSYYKYWYSYFSNVTSDDCGTDWYRDKWSKHQKLFDIPVEAHWVRLCIRNASTTNELRILNPSLSDLSSSGSRKAKSLNNENKIITDVANGIIIYPNPTTNTITVHVANTDNWEGYTTYKIFNINGYEVKTGFITSDNTEINISEFQSGLYFIKVIGTNSNITRKILKR
ncbi:DUF4855 domain-containing protein [Flammeovirgaceae bacterium SG7u.111]|nr:DUF4855 domain-containing protein [Flammeovirgaceae bacterium SG7u.132]WPO36967.1 DUF4855 domain-containing protein [Flammeovirgaceae bacterium SG7u.111]